MKIHLRNPDRQNWMSGYGVINRALDSLSNATAEEADVHLFVSPPYSFDPVDKTKFNVGLTMTERHKLAEYRWAAGGFVELCNRMDLIITPSPWCKQVFQHEWNQVKPPIEVVLLGHDHGYWQGPVKRRPGKHCLILDRGRDHSGAQNEAQKYFEEVTYVDCRTPRPTNSRNKDIIKNGRYTQAEIRKFYHEADVFLKWGREGWCFPILEAMSAGLLVITNCVHLGYVQPDKNCLVFRDAAWLDNHLRNASSLPLTEIKEEGQRTAANLTWEKTRKGLLDAIAKHYRK